MAVSTTDFYPDIWDFNNETKKAQRLAAGYYLGTKFDDNPKTLGTTGFEPATYCSQSSRATKLRHVPIHLI